MRRTSAHSGSMGRTGVAATLVTLLVLGAEKFLDSRVHSIQGESTLIRPSLVRKVAPRDRSAPDSTLDLSAYYNAPLTEAWYPGPKGNSLGSLPRGVQKFNGTTFDVRGLVQLSGAEINSYDLSEGYPRQIRGIPVDRWVKRLHLLQGAVSEVQDGGMLLVLTPEV